jgi:3-isopropylmalate dehydratase small subunit
VNSGDIIVAGRNFGCGSSREQAPAALKQAGVGLIIAESFARIFRRNAINIGLPVMIAKIGTDVQQGELAAVNLTNGEITVGKQKMQGQPLSENVLATIEAGGLINRVRNELGVKCGGN